MKWFYGLVLASLGLASLHAQNFAFQHPRPTSNHVNDAIMVSPTNWLLFCNAGEVLRSTDEGQTWSSSIPVSSDDIYEATFGDANTGYACGTGGVLMKTTDGGASWFALTSGTTTTLWYTDFINPDTGFVIGGASTALRTTDGGATWTPMTVGGNTTLYKVHYVNDTLVYIGTGSATPGRLMKSTNGGGTWFNVTGYTATGTVRGIFFLDPDTGWVSDQNYAIFKTTDGGASWFSQGDFGTGTFYEVKFFDAFHGLAAGGNGQVLATTDGGVNWVPTNTGYASNVYSLSLAGYLREAPLGTSNVLVAGEHGCTARSENSGQSWIQVSQSYMQEEIRDVTFLNANTGYASGGSGTTADSLGQIIKTTDGGQSWFLLGFNPKFRVYSADWTDANTGYIANRGPSGIFKTTDGGQNFTQLTPGSMSASGLWYSMNFFDADTGFAAGSGGIMVKTTNGGQSWYGLTSPFGTSIVYSIFIMDEHTVVASGSSGKVYKSTNGGASWLTATTNTTSTIYGLDFVDATTGYGCGATGRLIKTTDGGLNWTVLTSVSSSTLYNIQFADANAGWFCGSAGSLFGTTDGGATWDTLARIQDKILYDLDLTAGWLRAGGESGTVLRSTTQVSNAAPTAFDLLTPADGIRIVTAPSSTDSVLMTWTRSVDPEGQPVTYVFVVDTAAGFGSGAQQYVPSNNGGSDTVLTAHFSNIDDYVSGLGVAFGDSIVLHWKVESSDGVNTTTSNQDRSFKAVRVPFVPVPGWTIQTSGSFETINSVKQVSETVAWAAGNSGTVLRTVDGGLHWDNRNGNLPSDDFYAMTALDRWTAFVASAPGSTYVYRTTDGGDSWQEVFSQAAPGFIDGLHMFDEINGIGVGDPVGGTWTVVKTTDGGATWYRIGTEPTQVSGEAGWNNGLVALDEDHIWFTTSANHIYRTTDGGSTWTAPTIPAAPSSFAQIGFSDGQTGVVSMNGAIARSTDGGGTWFSAPLGGAGNVFGIAGAGTTDFWAGRGTVIYRSTDGGASWTSELPSGIGVIQALSFTTFDDQASGIAGGDAGGIATYYNPVTGIQDAKSLLPAKFALYPNYPNPFNPTTTIRYDVKEQAKVTLKVYNILGQEIRTLVNTTEQAGYRSVVWDGRNNMGQQVASGIYVYRIQMGNFVKSRKMMLIK